MAEIVGPRSYERCLNPALHGCETFDFAPADLGTLRERLRSFSAFSIHAPLPTWPDYPGQAVTSFLLDPDPTKRESSLAMLRQTVQVASDWGALYVVVHFGGLHSNGLSRPEVLHLADRMAAQLDAVAQEHDVALYLEYAAYNPSFATPEDLVEIVSHYPSLYVCLDAGHVRIGAEMLGIDEWDAIQVLAPHTRAMHLWTTRNCEDVRIYHHVPVHPKLTPADGWIDIPRLLDVVLTLCPDCAIVFEPSDLYNPDPAWQASGVHWVRELVAPYRSKSQTVPECKVQRGACVRGANDA